MAAQAIAALDLQHITCAFGGNGTRRGSAAPAYVAVKDVDLAVAPGEFVSVVGPTGCGKSTLLNVGAGLLAPSSGRVEVFGEPLAGINRRAGYMFQSESLMPWKTALANVVAGLVFRDVARPEAERKACAWLERVGLAGFEDRYPHQLSGGMRKRVAMAQTLILDPDIILMDEPFSALDIQTRQLMENELLALWAEPAPGKEGAPRAGRAVLFITHDLDEAISLSDRVVVLSAGPATHAMGSFAVDLPRPRNVAEIRNQERFTELRAQIWAVLRDEVLKGYDRQRRAA
ncbi:MAG: ABC transporter ATP-binding protein [Burkholderiaceae bacterium]|nr:MAG: ABC transporter ATP-binding protein [Burkholderiaceae bacterium]